MDKEVERHRLIRDSLELELQALRQRLSTVESCSDITGLENSSENNEAQMSRSKLLLVMLLQFLVLPPISLLIELILIQRIMQ